MNKHAGELAIQFDKFYSYLDEILQNHSKLALMLKKKLDAILKFDIDTIDDIIKEEQVFVLLNKGFDANLQSFMGKLSLTGGSLSAVIKEMPPDEQFRFQTLYAQLKSTLDEVKSLSSQCKALIEERVYTLEKSIQRINKAGTTAYKPGAQKSTGNSAHLFKKSV